MSILLKHFMLVLISIELLVHAANFNKHKLNLQRWNSFKMQFNKKYGSAEEDEYRMKIYLNNEKEIAEHNERFKNGEVSYEKEMSKFGDLTAEEFKNLYLSDTEEIPVQRPHVISLPTNLGPPPEKINWTALGFVTGVKNQGKCGSCWAFAAVGALESHYQIKYKKEEMIRFSEQNLVDCVGKRENIMNSCCGGNINHAYDYVKENGIATEESYPYKDNSTKCAKNVAENNDVTTQNHIVQSYPFQDGVNPKETNCNTELVKKDFAIKSYEVLSDRDEENLKRIVGLVGPVTASIRGTEFHLGYKKGKVFNGEGCLKQGNSTHAVLIVGYGTDEGQDYWLLKNSWGVDFGDYGYFRIARNLNNACGIANYNRYPVF